MRVVQQFPKLVKRKGCAAATYSGELTPMPGCPDIAISHAVYCHQGKGGGYGKLANIERMRQARELGYSGMICTVEVGNERQHAILIASGWVKGGEVLNRRTGHYLVTYSVSLL